MPTEDQLRAALPDMLTSMCSTLLDDLMWYLEQQDGIEDELIAALRRAGWKEE